MSKPIIFAEIKESGAAQVFIDGSKIEILEETVQEAQDAVLEQLNGIAQAQRDAILVTVKDPKGTWKIKVFPSGKVQEIKQNGKKKTKSIEKILIISVFLLIGLVVFNLLRLNLFEKSANATSSLSESPIINTKNSTKTEMEQNVKNSKLPDAEQSNTQNEQDIIKDEQLNQTQSEITAPINSASNIPEPTLTSLENEKNSQDSDGSSGSDGSKDSSSLNGSSSPNSSKAQNKQNNQNEQNGSNGQEHKKSSKKKLNESKKRITKKSNKLTNTKKVFKKKADFYH